MTQKLPQESLRPGMFISVGPSGFTISGVIGMGQSLPRVVPPDFMGPGNGPLAGQVSLIMANWLGLWLWGLAFWFFFVSVGAHWSTVRPGHARVGFAMTFYSYIFPNTALTTATFSVARALDGNGAINVVGCVMSGLLVCAWMAVFGMMVRAVVRREILWSQKQEDREEGGWKAWPGEKRVCEPGCGDEGGGPPPEGLPPVDMDGVVDEKVEEGVQGEVGVARSRRQRKDSAASPESSSSAATRFVDEIVRSSGTPGRFPRTAEDMV